ncbi:MAG: subtilisin-like proprotein convertase family protein [Neolewinella sp.]|jgi:subtilisin-like proprotein convertase family protein
MKRLLLLALVFCSAFALSAQSAFQFTGEDKASLNLTQLVKDLKSAPLEFTQAKSNTFVSLPLPSGDFAEYSVFSSPIVKNNDDLGSYLLSGPWGSGRIATSPHGVSGVINGPEGYFVIESLNDAGDSYRIVTYSDFMSIVAENQGPLNCGFDEANFPDFGDLQLNPNMGEDAGAGLVTKAGNEARELRVYDLIMTNTGEFANKFNGDPVRVLEAFNEAVSAINGIFEPELGVRMNLIDVPGLIYTDPNTDPYVNSNEGTALLGQVAPAFQMNGVTTDLYDLGHIFTAGCSDVGGVVSGAACTGGKTRGVTCVSFDVLGAALRIMAHEVAHQFAVSHSWNTCPGSEGQRAGQTAFEPGSGTTIMSYAGACGNQNIGGEQAYYHVGSLQQFLFFTREGDASACATVIETDNFTPEVDFNYEDGFSIPISTPFRLEGTASDANGDNLFYNWEQFDLGPSSDVQNPTGNAPLFRSNAPISNGDVRYFPRLDRIVNNIQNLSEVLPTYSRDMTFRLTARDRNAQAGGVDWKEMHFFAEETAGPFIVNNPADDVWNVGDFQEVTWDVANTDQAPVNCKRVNVLMSTNGGANFNIVLAENVVNNGSTFVTVPQEAISGDVHIMVEAADNIFLNINNSSFRVQAAEEAVFTLEANTRYEEVCLPDVLQIELVSGSVLGFNAPIALSVEADGLPIGTATNLSTAEIMPGNNSMLEIDLSGVNFTGRVDLTVVAVAEGQDTARRVIVLDLIDNDYSDLMTATPVEGTSGIILATEFSWADALNADSYDIQIGTSPTFSAETLFEETGQIIGTNFIPAEFFEPNTLYFWRIRPTNSCGDGAWLDPNSFRTVNSQCETYLKDIAVTIPGTGPAVTRESTLFIETQGAISDINLPNVNIRYNFVSKLIVTLVSPAGTAVVLYNENCFTSTNRLDLGFDDDAPVAVVCPPDDERVFKPVGTLADFNGEDTFGEWKLVVRATETGGSAGSIESWNIQFCADVSAVAPERLNNTATEVPPLLKNSIVKEKLQVTSSAFNTGLVNYSLTALPEAGRLLLYGVELAVGDEFQQDDINGNGLFYENTDGTATTDDFGFVVTTPDGGYLAIDYHDIIITEDATVSNGNVSVLEDNLTVYPNPTVGDLNVRWTADINRDLNLELYDLNGRLLSQRTVNGRTQAATVSTADLPTGVYLLRIDGAVRRVVKR